MLIFQCAKPEPIWQRGVPVLEEIILKHFPIVSPAVKEKRQENYINKITNNNNKHSFMRN